MSFVHLFSCSHRLLVALLPCLPLAAQASFTTFGTSCSPGLALAANGLPHLGTAFFFSYAGPLGSSFVGLYNNLDQPVLLLGVSNTQAGTVPLPAPLPTTWTAGLNCELRVSPDVLLVHPLSAAPPFGLSIAIPATPGLIGFPLHAQWLLLSERSYFGQPLWLRAFLSNAGTAVLGP